MRQPDQAPTQTHYTIVRLSLKLTSDNWKYMRTRIPFSLFQDAAADLMKDY